MSISPGYLVSGNTKDNKGKNGALNKIHQLVQGKAVGFTHLWTILFFCHISSSVVVGLELDLAYKAKPLSSHRPVLDLGRSLILDFNNKIR